MMLLIVEEISDVTSKLYCMSEGVNTAIVFSVLDQLFLFFEKKIKKVFLHSRVQILKFAFCKRYKKVFSLWVRNSKI